MDRKREDSAHKNHVTLTDLQEVKASYLGLHPEGDIGMDIGGDLQYTAARKQACHPADPQSRTLRQLATSTQMLHPLSSFQPGLSLTCPFPPAAAGEAPGFEEERL